MLMCSLYSILSNTHISCHTIIIIIIIIIIIMFLILRIFIHIIPHNHPSHHHHHHTHTHIVRGFKSHHRCNCNEGTVTSSVDYDHMIRDVILKEQFMFTFPSFAWQTDHTIPNQPLTNPCLYYIQQWNKVCMRHHTIARIPGYSFSNCSLTSKLIALSLSLVGHVHFSEILTPLTLQKSQKKSQQFSLLEEILHQLIGPLLH